MPDSLRVPLLRSLEEYPSATMSTSSAPPIAFRRRVFVDARGREDVLELRFAPPQARAPSAIALSFFSSHLFAEESAERFLVRARAGGNSLVYHGPPSRVGPVLDADFNEDPHEVAERELSGADDWLALRRDHELRVKHLLRRAGTGRTSDEPVDAARWGVLYKFEKFLLGDDSSFPLSRVKHFESWCTTLGIGMNVVLQLVVALTAPFASPLGAHVSAWARETAKALGIDCDDWTFAEPLPNAPKRKRGF